MAQLSCDWCGEWHEPPACLVLDGLEQAAVLTALDCLAFEYPIKNEVLVLLIERMRGNEEVN